MTIDMHVHPGFIAEIAGDDERIAFRRKHFGLYKQHVWPLQLVLQQLDAAGLDKAVLMPEDLTTRAGNFIVSNQEVHDLAAMAPERFIPFASVDPHRPDAVDALTHAFTTLGAAGLRLNPSTQRFYPNEDKLAPLYEICLAHNKPVVLDMGMSLEPGAPAKYAQPLLLEDVLMQYPGLRVCAAHFSYPWVLDTAVLMLRYENLYADTAMLYFDSPKEFFEHVFGSLLGKHWVNRTLHSQVMFASNYPRIEQARMVDAVRAMALNDRSLRRVMGGNAQKFLYGGEA